MAEIKRRHFILGSLGVAGGLVVGWSITPPRQRLTPSEAIDVERGEAALNGWVKVSADFLPLFRANDDGAVASAARHMTRKIARETGFIVTGGSTSIKDQWLPMREAGASARQMLICGGGRAASEFETEAHSEDNAGAESGHDLQALWRELRNTSRTGHSGSNT